MIAVTGASGQLGRLVIHSLLEKTDPTNVLALVRDPDKLVELKALGIHVRKADYNQPETLDAALRGVRKLLLISGNEVGRRVPQHQAVIDAAKKAGVELLAYTSILRAPDSPLALAREHQETETAIRASGLPAVILRNGWYNENYTQSLPGVLEAGIVAGAAREGRLHTAARRDYAEAAAEVLTSADNQAGNVYELAGDSGFTLEEYAVEISRQSAKDIQYRSLSGDEFTELLVRQGLPEGFATLLADAEVHAADGWLANDDETLSRLIGRPTTPISESIAAVV